jgi:aspartate/methionine/tyrosine aminotransferase
MDDFYRIRRLPPYVFEEVNRAKARARNGGADIIDLGMGNPDLPRWASRAPTVIRPRAASPACAARRLPITRAASG